jgi:hypothetical protein
MGDANAGIKAYYIDPHDLVVAKLAAARDKDRVFIRELLVRGLVNSTMVERRIGKTPVSGEKKAAMAALFGRLVADCARLIDGLPPCPP